jgi:hypothetical protein
MKRSFCGFDHCWSFSESASHAILSSCCCQQASSIHQDVGRPGIGLHMPAVTLTESNWLFLLLSLIFQGFPVACLHLHRDC